MHFDARVRRVPHRPVAKRADVEVGAELAVDPDEQIEVERGGHAERIVVRQEQLPLRLDEIRAKQKRVAAPERPGEAPEQGFGRRGIEVADVRAEEQRQGKRLRESCFHCRCEPVFISVLVRDDGHAREDPDGASCRVERDARDIDEVYL